MTPNMGMPSHLSHLKVVGVTGCVTAKALVLKGGWEVRVTVTPIYSNRLFILISIGIG